MFISSAIHAAPTKSAGISAASRFPAHHVVRQCTYRVEYTCAIVTADRTGKFTVCLVTSWLYRCLSV